MAREIYITENDLESLYDLLQSGTAGSARDHKNVEELEAELDRAHVVDAKKIPVDVITLNSRAVLRDLDTNEEMTYTLVFPGQAKLEEGRISILAPIGTAMLGYRVGDVIEWKVPAGIRRLKVEKLLYQPEAAGDYHL